MNNTQLNEALRTALSVRSNRRNRLESDICNVELVKATPETVDALLAGNICNRPIVKSLVSKLTMSFKKGEYVFNGQPIIRDRNGFLKDGQHRLYALREAGYPPVTILLVTLCGSDAEIEKAYNSMDIGAIRKFAALLKHNGVENPNQVASLCKKLTYLATGYVNFPVLPDSYLEDVRQLYRKEIDAIAPLLKTHGFLADMGTAACVIAKVTGCLDEIVGLIKRASEGDMLKIGTPAHTLFKIINTRNFDYRGTTRNAFHFAIVAHCLIAELNNETYPCANKSIKKALKWITDMARDNQVFILPKKIDTSYAA